MSRREVRNLSNRRRSACCRCVYGPATERRGLRSLALPLCRFCSGVSPRQINKIFLVLTRHTGRYYVWVCVLFNHHDKLVAAIARYYGVHFCSVLEAIGLSCFFYFVLYIVQSTSTSNYSLRPHATDGNSIRCSLCFRA